MFTCSLQTPTYQNPDAMLTKILVFLSIDRQTERQMDRQTDRQMDRQMDRQTDRQTDRHRQNTDRQRELKASVNTTKTSVYHQ